MTVQRRRLLALTAAALAAPLLTACERLGLGGSKPQFSGIDITGAEYARKLSLPDTSGRTRSLEDFKGKVVVVFFGFTQCPDVCPGTLAELAQVKQELGPAGERVQGVLVTLDPERDTPEVLQAYVANFGADFVALRGSLEQTQAAAKEFKVFFAKSPGKTEGSYSIDHTAGSFVFDAQGRVRLFERYGAGPEALKKDLGLLLGGA